jgi:hypothetical protein
MGVEEVKSTFKNPIDKGEIFRGILFGSLTFIVCITFTSIISEFSIFKLILATIFGMLVGWFMGFWSELWTRPKIVEIRDDGILLIFWPWRPRKFILWSDIRNLNVLLEDPKKSEYKVGRDGFLWTWKRKSFTIFWPIANSVREAYKEHLGEYPPISWKPSAK